MVRNVSPEGQVQMGEAVDRLIEALRLYKRGVAPLILVTGGNLGVLSSNEWSEAQGMLDFLTLAGVPSQAILLEDQAQNTYQNALYSRPLLELVKAQRVLLVTSAFHMKRSLAIFKRQEIPVTPYSVDSRLLNYSFPLNLLPSLRAFGIVDMVVREVVGYIVYAGMGYL
jgi:uncharacterized SAM-binding protein YcdF (DUF218 family)